MDDRVDMDEVQALDLVGLQSMWTFHSRKHAHYLLRQSAAGTDRYTSGSKHYGHKPAVTSSTSTLLSNVTKIVDIILDFKWFQYIHGTVGTCGTLHVGMAT